MTQIIIYPNGENVAVVTPTGLIPIAEVARKDVPAGTPYRIVDATAEWEPDFSNPDGYGIGAEAWFAEQSQ